MPFWPVTLSDSLALQAGFYLDVFGDAIPLRSLLSYQVSFSSNFDFVKGTQLDEEVTVSPAHSPPPPSLQAANFLGSTEAITLVDAQVEETPICVSPFESSGVPKELGRVSEPLPPHRRS